MCAEVCPESAISIIADEEGFLYPSVDNLVCTRCGLCARTCAFINHFSESASGVTPRSYVAKHLDQTTRMNSRSGAVFVACSDWILDNGGSVYGCVLDSNLIAVHIRATNKVDRDRMCRSKYVQSDTREIFNKVQTDLNEKRLVLYTGTGCQIDSLNKFLLTKGCETSNLFTLDIICHGVPSPLIFSDFIKWVERSFKGKVIEFDFRDKSQCGWDGHIESATLDGKKYIGVIFRELFYSNLCIRPSCYNCKYASASRISDITIGDAWGIKKALPEFNDNRGVSLVIINSKKGLKLLDIIKETCETKKVDLHDFLQKNLCEPSSPLGDRNRFWQFYFQGGIDNLIKIYANQSWLLRSKYKIKYFIRKLTKPKWFYLP
jgi:coenzyme F420-reducing hydrogenase beta subunit